MNIIVASNRIDHDPNGREVLNYLKDRRAELSLEEAVVYYDFPTYADYEGTQYKADILVLSRDRGIVALRVLGAGEATPLFVAQVGDSLEQFTSLLFTRLLKSRLLRTSISAIAFPVVPLIVSFGAQDFSAAVGTSHLVTSLEALNTRLRSQVSPTISETQFAEGRSVIEGAKALTRPQRRIVQKPDEQPAAVALSLLEAEIANFDERQRRTALVTISGPQRIRGLAGSGKTVILAMKAAHLHLNNPDDRILVTFYTRSLRSTITSLVSKFYRHYKDEDPDWEHLHIRHGWGGARTQGVYADACRRSSRAPLSFGDARREAGRDDPFNYACQDLLNSGAVEPYYDTVLIDEGQDFPDGFYRLCYAVAKGDGDEKNLVWAYDELQNIMNVTLRTPAELYGKDSDGNPRISLERAAAGLPPDASNDVVLSKCYRNQREVLVTAHAMGFGIYGNIVQMLESREHWEDVGYEVESGALKVGEPVRIVRPAENSPVSINDLLEFPLTDWKASSKFEDEIGWAVDQIAGFIKAGLQPDDVMVVALDDQNAKGYATSISEALAERGIKSNNILADPYTEPPFTVADCVTLSTVYRAKGNEAALVIAVGLDGIDARTRSSRNKLFTAFTRSKAWLRVSGIGATAELLLQELEKAKEHIPYLDFIMPDLSHINLIQRDLSVKEARAKKLREEFLRRAKAAGFSEEEALDLFSETPIIKNA